MRKMAGLTISSGFLMVCLTLISIAAPYIPNHDAPDDRFQSVSGSFARQWLLDNMERKPATTSMLFNQTAQNNSSREGDLKMDLWSWGNIPKGKILQDGKLLNAKNATYRINSSEWLGGIWDYPQNADKNTWRPSLQG
ncbi:MAG TPA: hypothetical protein PK918_10280 [Methanotrichaceae archaeon]|nr:hypothetical protein [Methanotrichaceae archaeon]HQJ29452.1 hypothetical protein [Methanotrichaceae archaeon]